MFLIHILLSKTENIPQWGISAKKMLVALAYSTIGLSLFHILGSFSYLYETAPLAHGILGQFVGPQISHIRPTQVLASRAPCTMASFVGQSSLHSLISKGPKLSEGWYHPIWAFLAFKIIREGPPISTTAYVGRGESLLCDKLPDCEMLSLGRSGSLLSFLPTADWVSCSRMNIREREKTVPQVC